MPRQMNDKEWRPENESGVTVQIELRAPVRARLAVAGDQRRHAAPPLRAPERIPRIARLMALAIKFQDMIDRSEVRDYADIARLGHVTRARITQIMNLLNLAPDIQAEILGLNGLSAPYHDCAERDLRSATRFTLWSDQRRGWQTTRRAKGQRIDRTRRASM